MVTIPNPIRALRPVDLLIVTFVSLMSLIALVFPSRVTVWPMLVGLNVAVSILIIILAYAATKPGAGRIVTALHDWYAVPSVFLLFKEVYVVIQSLGHRDWDQVFIDADRWMFGGIDPTVWMAQYVSPVLTEIMQLAYTSYYFILLAVPIAMHRRGDKHQFSFILFTLFYGFCLSYLGYIVFPAVGPRFTLHDFHALDIELPGLFLTEAIRDLINAGESIPKGIPDAFTHAQRDAFPSGHTQLTLISLYFAYRHRLKSRHILSTFGFMLLISTVYLRYHYVIDLVAGVVFAWLTVATADRLFNWWEAKRLRAPRAALEDTIQRVTVEK